MITHKQLQEAGFKQFRQKGLWRFTDTGWQLCVRDTEGNKLYFITIAEYDNKEFPGIEQRSGRYSFEPEGQFVTSKGVTFNLTMIGAESIEQVLSFFNEVYNKLDCVVYDWLFTPDKKTIYMMAAGYTGQKVVENIGSSEAVGKVQIILNNKLDEIIVEQQKKLSK